MSENIYIKKYLEKRKRENIEKQKKLLLYKNNPDRDLYQKCQKYSSENTDGPSTSKYIPPADNIPSTPILKNEDALKYSKSIKASEQKNEPKHSNSVTSCIDCKKHIWDCEKYCKFCNISADCINCSMSAHHKICKNKNKIQCKKCLKFYPWKSYQLHIKLKDCTKINTYSCLHCNEIYLTARELATHLQLNHHNLESIKNNLEKLMYSSCKYEEELPWEFSHLSSSERRDVLLIYSQWGHQIFKNKLFDSQNICPKYTITICPNLSFSSQIVEFLTGILQETKKSFKVNLYPAYILQNRNTQELKFHESFRNLAVFEYSSPKIVHHYKDVHTHFEHLTYSDIDEKILENRPDTSYQSLFMTSIHVDITYLDSPIGQNSTPKRKWTKSVISIPSKNNMCIFKSIAYGLFCKKNKLEYLDFNKNLSERNSLSAYQKKMINEKSILFYNDFIKRQKKKNN